MSTTLFSAWKECTGGWCQAVSLQTAPQNAWLAWWGGEHPQKLADCPRGTWCLAGSGFPWVREADTAVLLRNGSGGC